MFTGLIEAVGRLQDSQAHGGDLRLRVSTGGLPIEDLQFGESIAVSASA